MKKILSVILAAGMLLSMAGCSRVEQVSNITSEDVQNVVSGIDEAVSNLNQSAEDFANAANEIADAAGDAVSAAKDDIAEGVSEIVDDVKEDISGAVTGATFEERYKQAAAGEVVDGIVKVRYELPAVVPENESLQFIQDLEIGYNLGNTFDANNCTWLTDELDYQTAWCGAKTTRELIVALKEAGFKTIRIPVSWHNHVDENYRISEAWMARVQEVVDWAYDEGFYVIINIHHDNEADFEYPSYDKLENSKKYVTAIWEQIAERFADYDEHLIFETMNEPRQVGTDHEWWIGDTESDVAKECFDCVNQLNQVIVDTIRANGKGYNTSRYIMAPPYCANPDYALVKDFKLPEDPDATAENRIILSIHAYTPYSFALEQPGVKEFSIAEGKGTGDIESFMKAIYAKFVLKGTPVLIGEFGALDKDNTDSRMQFTAYYIATAEKYGFSAVWWDNNAYHTDGENFRLIDRANLTWTYPEIVDQMMYYSGNED